jgi:hypothetical protein
MRSPPITNEAISEGLPGAWQSANHFPLTRYKSGNTKKLSASPSRDRSVAGRRYSDRRIVRQSRRVLPLPGRRGGVFEPAIKAVAVSKNFMPQSSRSKMPREFVKASCLRKTARNRRVRSRVTSRGESILRDQLALVIIPPRPCADLPVYDQRPWTVIDDKVGRQINKS